MFLIIAFLFVLKTGSSSVSPGQPGLQRELQDSQGYTGNLVLKNRTQNQRQDSLVAVSSAEIIGVTHHQSWLFLLCLLFCLFLRRCETGFHVANVGL